MSALETRQSHESSAKVKVGVHRSGYIDGSAEVGYQTKDGTAKAPDDYEEVRGTSM